MKKYEVLIGSLLLIAGFNLGWLGFMWLGNCASNTKIFYLSKNELLDHEQARIKSTGQDLTMFFGRTDEALKLIQTLVNSYQTRDTKVIIASDKIAEREDIVSISKTIHNQVIAKLSQSIDQNIDRVVK